MPYLCFVEVAFYIWLQHPSSGGAKGLISWVLRLCNHQICMQRLCYRFECSVRLGLDNLMRGGRNIYS
jgi:hypothetical protein